MKEALTDTPEFQAELVARGGRGKTRRIHCNSCGNPVSNEVPVGTVVRAWVECPECCEKNTEWADKLVSGHYWHWCGNKWRNLPPLLCSMSCGGTGAWVISEQEPEWAPVATPNWNRECVVCAYKWLEEESFECPNCGGYA